MAQRDRSASPALLRGGGECVDIRGHRTLLLLLLLVAGLALGLGSLVYLIDRGTTQSQGLPAVALPAAWVGLQLFGSVGLWLPSFVHPLAFGLLTAAVLPRRAAPAYGACIAWGAVNLAFEAGQHPQLSGGLARALSGALGDTALTRPLVHYFLRGSFDVGDIAAAVAGALLAAAVLRLLHREPERDHAH